MKDEVALKTLYEMIDHCTQERETPIAQRVVNHYCAERGPMENLDSVHKLGNMMWIMLS
jgi:hypothetical protein